LCSSITIVSVESFKISLVASVLVFLVQPTLKNRIAIQVMEVIFITIDFDYNKFKAFCYLKSILQKSNHFFLSKDFIFAQNKKT
jgi:hypothetical protein